MLTIPASTFRRDLGARVIHQDLSHDSRGQIKKVRAVLPANLPCTGQAQERFIDQCGRLQGVPLPLASHIASGQPAQLRFHQRNELLERCVVAVAPSPQQFSDGTG